MSATTYSRKAPLLCESSREALGPGAACPRPCRCRSASSSRAICRRLWRTVRIPLPSTSAGHPLELCAALAADAINYAVDGLDKFNTEKEVAQYLRKAFVDKVCHATAHRHGRSPAASVPEPPTPQSAACTPHTCHAAVVGDSRARRVLAAARLARFWPGGTGVALDPNGVG